MGTVAGVIAGRPAAMISHRGIEAIGEQGVDHGERHGMGLVLAFDEHQVQQVATARIERIDRGAAGHQ